jgi:hypothetical protein
MSKYIDRSSHLYPTIRCIWHDRYAYHNFNVTSYEASPYSKIRSGAHLGFRIFFWKISQELLSSTWVSELDKDPANDRTCPSGVSFAVGTGGCGYGFKSGGMETDRCGVLNWPMKNDPHRARMADRELGS